MVNVILKIRNNALSLQDCVVEFSMNLMRKHSSSIENECKNYIFKIKFSINYLF